MSEARGAVMRARGAVSALAQASTEVKNQALYATAAALRTKCATVLEANAFDCEQARKTGISDALLDRLMLNENRVYAMADALEALACLDDPVGKIIEERTLYNGLRLRKVTVPLGVVAMVYEARPNVTADAAGICLKSGNAAVLRGGSIAVHSNNAIALVLRDAVTSVGLPADCIVAIESTDRRETDELLSLHGLVDVLIPRGGAGLIQHCVEHATVPVIETGTGNCHVYVQESADFETARAIIMNAKTQRPGVCNAEESLLVDASIAQEFLPDLFVDLAQAGVIIHGDEEAFKAAQMASASSTIHATHDVCPEGSDEILSHFVAATEDDWGREYLGLEISVKVIEGGVDQAIDHINRYGTGHSECIVTNNQEDARRFQQLVDAAAVYVNASTRFTDGGEFGLGAEIGISTQKLHVRGPFALEALTSSKYLINGEGQVRS